MIIPAKDEEDRIGATVRAARAIPHVDLVVVVDDGSSDGTQKAARTAGATVIRHSVNRGKASAMETGASVVAMRDEEGRPARLLLFLDADLGESAVEAAPLVEPVLAGAAVTADAFDTARPDPGGAQQERALRLALERAGIGPDKIGHVNAHATSTPVGDRVEAEVLARLDRAAYRVVLARRFHDTRVAQARRLRADLVVRLLHLAGRAPMPQTFDVDDDTGPAGAAGA